MRSKHLAVLGVGAATAVAVSACGVPDQQSRPLSAVELPSASIAALSASAASASAASASASASAASASASAASASASSASASAIPTGSGPVNVLYAGSLVDLMQKQIAPGFEKATGYNFVGYSAGSTALASQIKGKVHAGDVFISASPSVDTSLEGGSNGNWVSWYATYASSPLVIGYNPNSSFANDLKTKSWDQVVKESGFKLGTTDPKTDPKGRLAQQALQSAGLSTDIAQTYPEETLVARLQSGQLDAGFLYQSEAIAADLPTVPLNDNLKATYTVTVLNKAPHEQGAVAFVDYLLSKPGQAALEKFGYDLVSPPTVSGSGVPADLRGVLSGS